MGSQASTAEAISHTVNKSVTNVMMANSSTCGQNNASSQNLRISDIQAKQGCSIKISGVSQVLSQTPNFTCLADNNQESNLKTALLASLSSSVKSETGGIGGALASASNSKVVSDIVNDITTNINVSNTAKCIQDNLADQDLQIQSLSGSCSVFCRSTSDNAVKALHDNPNLCEIDLSNISQSMTQGAVGTCTSKNTALTDAITSAASKISQLATSENTGFDPLKDLANIFGSVGKAYIAIVIICLCLCCLPSIISVISMLSSGSKSSSGSIDSSGSVGSVDSSGSVGSVDSSGSVGSVGSVGSQMASTNFDIPPDYSN